MVKTYQETVILQEDTCASCGILFAAPQHWFASKRSTGTAFYCPNGHSLTFSESTETRLKKQLEAEQERTRQVEIQLTSAKDQLQATKHELQKHKKRVVNGVCPYCNRTFAQLQRHMKSKHADHVATK